MSGMRGRTRRQNKASEFVLSPMDVQKILNACTLRDRCLIGLLYYSGLRRAEAVGLDIPDIDYGRKLVRVRRGKGAKERFVPLHPDIAESLALLIGERKTGPVFLPEYAEGRRLSLRSVNEICARVAASVGVTNPNPRRMHVSPHLFRHSFARHFLANGGDLRVLSHILGHTGIGITADVYGTPTIEDIQAGYSRWAHKEGSHGDDHSERADPGTGGG